VVGSDDLSDALYKAINACSEKQNAMQRAVKRVQLDWIGGERG
jgi:hypothetical protein